MLSGSETSSSLFTFAIHDAEDSSLRNRNDKLD